MKHSTSKLLAVLLASAASAGAMAQQSAAPSFNVKVTGTITPGSCSPASNELLFNMGDIDPAGLKVSEVTQQKAITQPITITCTADTAIALSVTGSRKAAGAAYAVDMTHLVGAGQIQAAAAYLFDLLDPNNNNARVGVYAMQLRGFKYTGGGEGAVTKDAVVINSADKGATWAANTDMTAWYMGQWKVDGSNLLSFATTEANTTPVAAKTFTGSLVIAPQILPKKDIKITGELKFEGGATITLTYI